MSHEDQAEKASKDERVQSRSETSRKQNNYYVNHHPTSRHPEIEVVGEK